MDPYTLPFPYEFWRFLQQETNYPYIASKDELDQVPKRLGPSDEFCLSSTFNPNFIDSVCNAGYFPMAIPAFDGFIMAIKLHENRCALPLKDLHVERTTRKLSNNYQISMDLAFDEVVAMVVAKHGDNWLCPLLRRAFKEMFDYPGRFKTKLHSCEIWEGDKMVAGELGYAVGGIYTSLTGAYAIPRTGSVQLCTLGRLLQARGYDIWDFGMEMGYKKALGAKLLPRAQWLAQVKLLRDKEAPDLKIEGKKSAREIIDLIHPPTTTLPPPSNPTSEPTSDPTSVSKKRKKRIEKKEKQAEKKKTKHKQSKQDNVEESRPDESKT